MFEGISKSFADHNLNPLSVGKNGIEKGGGAKKGMGLK